MLRYFSTLALVLYLITPSYSQEKPSSFYNQSDKKGWWWYEQHKDKKKEEEKKETSPSPSQPKEPSLSDYTYDELWNMDPAEFSKLIDKLRNKAIRTLKEEDTIEYLIAQDIAVRKAEAYSNVAMYAAQKYNELSEPKVSTSVPGTIARSIEYSEEDNRIISKYKDKYGVLFFTQEGCVYCLEQRKIIRNHWNIYVGLEIVEVDIKESPDLASSFGVNYTPTLILVQRDSNNSFPISYGVNDIATIKRNIYQAIKYLEGDRTPEMFLKKDLDLRYDAMNDKNYYRDFYEKTIGKNKRLCDGTCK